MFSKLSQLFVGFLVLTLAVGCGRKGDPTPPPSLAPSAVFDLQASQQGPEIVLRFSYPSVTESGLPLGEIQGISILRFDREAPELMELEEDPTEEPIEGDAAGDGMETQAGAESEPVSDSQQEDLVGDDLAHAEENIADEDNVETDPFLDPMAFEESSEVLTLAVEEAEAEPIALPKIDQRLFESFAGTIKEFEQSEVGGLIDGNQIVIRLRDEVFPDEPWIYAYAVVVQANERNSATSNIAQVNPVAPPEPIVSLVAEPTAAGIRISWSPLDDETVSDYRVYRRAAEDAQFGEPIETVSISEPMSLLDAAVELGRRWVYAITAVGPRGVESAWGSQREIFYRDVFAPEAPTALVAIPDSTGIRLLWRHRPPNDHQGYSVIRSQEDDSATLNETLISGLEYTDRTAVSGRQYTYQVVASDRSGNASEPSEPVEVVAP